MSGLGSPHRDNRGGSKQTGSTFRTEVDAEIESITFVDKLHIGFVKANPLPFGTIATEHPNSSTNGIKVEAMSLGVVQVKICARWEEPLKNAATMAQLSDFYKKQSLRYRRQYSWRFTDPDAADIAPFAGGSRYKFSLVTN